jgi:hypothetical protein
MRGRVSDWVMVDDFVDAASAAALETEAEARAREFARRKAAFLQRRAARAANATARPQRARPMIQPRYDDVFFAGLAWLDELADAEIPAWMFAGQEEDGKEGDR